MIIEKNATRIVRTGGKVFELPRVLPFCEGLSAGQPHLWEPDEYRVAKDGEWFISGAIPAVYKAVGDGVSPFLIVTRGRRMKQVSSWAPAD